MAHSKNKSGRNPRRPRKVGEFGAGKLLRDPLPTLQDYVQGREVIIRCARARLQSMSGKDQARALFVGPPYSPTETASTATLPWTPEEIVRLKRTRYAFDNDAVLVSLRQLQVTGGFGKKRIPVIEVARHLHLPIGRAVEIVQVLKRQLAALSIRIADQRTFRD